MTLKGLEVCMELTPKVLITGGAGFIGSRLGFYLYQLGYDVYLLDNLNHGYSENLTINGESFGTFIDSDIRDNNLARHTYGMDYVVHLAGISSLPLCQSKPMYAMDVNTGGTANVLEACRIAGVKRVVFASTGAVYENNTETPFKEDITVNPFLIYPLSKVQAEQLCQSYNACYDMDITVLRFFNVYGPHQDFKRKHPPFTGYLLKQFLNKEEINFFSDGEQERDYIHIDDLNTLIATCLTNKNASGQTFNACSGKSYSVKHITSVMMELLNAKNSIRFSPAEAYWDNHPTLHKGNFPIKRSIVAQEVNKYCVGDTSKTKELLGWEAQTTLKDGLRGIVDLLKVYDSI